MLVEDAKKEIESVWEEYQQTAAPVRKRFGQVCYEWQQKLKTVELHKVWKELKIEENLGYEEIGFYLTSIGQKRLRIEKRSNREEEPDSFEDQRKLALVMLKIGYDHIKKTDVKRTTLDSAKTWATLKLKEKSE